MSRTTATAGPAGPHALGLDAAHKKQTLIRLRRIEGQLRGVQKMVDEERYCVDVLTQLSSVQEALRAVSRELLRSHLKHCATAAIRAGDAQAEVTYDELVDLMYRHLK